MDFLTAAEFSFILFFFRVIVGLVFASHGWAKRKGGISGTAAWFDSMGMKPGRLNAEAASLTEIGAGLLLAIGLATPFAAAAIVGVMVVAGYTVHRKNGFFIVKDGWEYTFIVALMAVVIAGLGPGDWSADASLGWIEPFVGYTGMIIAVGIGVVAGIAQIAVFYRPPKS